MAAMWAWGVGQLFRTAGCQLSAMSAPADFGLMACWGQGGILTCSGHVVRPAGEHIGEARYTGWIASLIPSLYALDRSLKADYIQY